MSKSVRLLFAGCMLFQGGFVKAGDATESTVVVEVYNPAGFEEATIASAERIVSNIFRRLGVELVWEREAAVGRLDSGPDEEGRRPDFEIHLVPVTATVMGGRHSHGGVGHGGRKR
jgi:hypothetical protein